MKSLNLSYGKVGYKEVFPDSSVGKESTCNAGGPISIPRLGRSSGEGKAYPLQYSDLENFMDCIVHGVSKSQTKLNDFHSIHLFLKSSTLSFHFLINCSLLKPQIWNYWLKNEFYVIS